MTCPSMTLIGWRAFDNFLEDEYSVIVELSPQTAQSKNALKTAFTPTDLHTLD
jgi:hypothetical protein